MSLTGIKSIRIFWKLRKSNSINNMVIHTYVNRKPNGQGFVLTDGHRIIVDAQDIENLVDGIIDNMAKNGLEGKLYLKLPQKNPSFHISESEAITGEEYREFWNAYASKLVHY